jgi:hypothetical protein
MTKTQSYDLKSQSLFRICLFGSLDIVCYLRVVICDLLFRILRIRIWQLDFFLKYNSYNMSHISSSSSISPRLLM